MLGLRNTEGSIRTVKSKLSLYNIMESFVRPFHTMWVLLLKALALFSSFNRP